MSKTKSKLTDNDLDQLDAMTEAASSKSDKDEIEPLTHLWQQGYKLALRGDLVFHTMALDAIPKLTAEVRDLRRMLHDLSPDVPLDIPARTVKYEWKDEQKKSPKKKAPKKKAKKK